jgi:cardiolipin synthase
MPGGWSFHEAWHLLGSGLGILVGVLHIACIPLVLARRREPAVTLAWLLGLLLLPAIGVVLFWVFGRGAVRRTARPRQRLLEGRRISESHPDLGEVDEALRPLANAAWQAGMSAVTGGNRVHVLVNGQQAYPAKLEAIAKAERTLDAAYYIFSGDETGRRFRDALTAAAERGVRVRLLLDAVGCAWTWNSFFNPLRKAGGEVRTFLPLSPLRARTLNLRNHRKILVADGSVGFTGGINIGDEFGGWRDTHLRIEGPAAADLETVFSDDWAYTTGQAPKEAPAKVNVGSDSFVQILPSGPDDRAEAIYQVYFAAIATAASTIDLTTPYFIPDRAIAVALVSAALRGVQVRILMPGSNNQQLTDLASRSYFDELLEAGVQIFLYDPGMIHAKTLVIDRAWASVGTANMDVRSFRLNFEVNALLYGGPEVLQLADIFEQDLARSQRLDPIAFGQRSFWERAVEGGARLLSPIL